MFKTLFKHFLGETVFETKLNADSSGFLADVFVWKNRNGFKIFIESGEPAQERNPRNPLYTALSFEPSVIDSLIDALNAAKAEIECLQKPKFGRPE